MKKLLLVLAAAAALVLCMASCASKLPENYPRPDFDQPFSQVLDAFDAPGRLDDNVKLHNKSSDSGMSFNVYTHDPVSGAWLLWGRADLKGKDDTDTIDTDRDNLGDYRYFAVESLNGKSYRFSVYKNRDDLNIDVIDE